MANILIVEDSRVKLHIVRRILQSEGHTVFSAEDGLVGLAQLEATPNIDLIISDIHMPNCDGLEFVARTRANGYTIPIVLLTATGDETYRLKADELDVEGFLTQPFDSADLLAMVGSLLVSV